MIKAEINKTHIKAELNGDLATIMSEIHGFLADILKDIQDISGERKEHLLTLIYQKVMKEWSKENENN